MKNIMAMLFGSAKDAYGPPPQFALSRLDNQPTIGEGSENAIRRQLIQVLLRDLLRKSGIPTEWIQCEMLLVASRSKGPGMYVRLVVKQWDDRLMHYLYAVQTEFMIDIERFEPDCRRWMHGISWQFEVNDSCPHTKLPPKDFWSDRQTKITAPQVQNFPSRPRQSVLAPKAAVEYPPNTASLASATAASNSHDSHDDLKALFAIRDRELSRNTADGHAPVGYETTQPSAL